MRNQCLYQPKTSLIWCVSVCYEVSVVTQYKRTQSQIISVLTLTQAHLLNAQALRPGKPAGRSSKLQMHVISKPARVRVSELFCRYLNCCGPKVWSSGHLRALLLPHEQCSGSTQHTVNSQTHAENLHATFNSLYSSVRLFRCVKYCLKRTVPWTHEHCPHICKN